MTLPDLPVDTRADRLRAALGDRVVLAEDAAYDVGRIPWNVAIDQHPFAVARPETAEEVVDVVRAATASGLRVAPQATGHAAGALADTDLSDVVLVSCAASRRDRRSRESDRSRSRRIQWNDVLAVAAAHGLTGMHGSSGDVSVVGYVLSGGLSFYGRTQGSRSTVCVRYSS